MMTDSAEAPLSLDAQLDAALADSPEPVREDATDETIPVEVTEPEAKAAPKPTEGASAKMLRQRGSALAKLELDLASQRGAIETDRKLHADRLAKADRLDGFIKAASEDPAAALEELLGEDFGDLYERIAKAKLGHDPSAKKLGGLEKQLADVQAKFAAKDKAEAEQQEHARLVAQGEAVAKKYIAGVAAGGERWPSLQLIDPTEVVQAADAYGVRMRALTGKLPSHEEISDALEEHAARELAKRAPAAKQPAAKAKPGTKTLAPEAGSDRATERKLSLDEKLEAVMRDGASALPSCEVGYRVAKLRTIRIANEKRTVEAQRKGSTHGYRELRTSDNQQTSEGHLCR